MHGKTDNHQPRPDDRSIATFVVSSMPLRRRRRNKLVGMLITSSFLGTASDESLSLPVFRIFLLFFTYAKSNLAVVPNAGLTRAWRRCAPCSFQQNNGTADCTFLLFINTLLALCFASSLFRFYQPRAVTDCRFVGLVSSCEIYFFQLNACPSNELEIDQPLATVLELSVHFFPVARADEVEAFHVVVDCQRLRKIPTVSDQRDTEYGSNMGPNTVEHRGKRLPDRSHSHFEGRR